MTEIASAASTSGVRIAAGRSWRVPIVIPVCFIVLTAVALMAIFGALLAPQNPNAQNLSNVLAHPSGAHWLGTDQIGRDEFARLVAGARLAFIGPLVVATVSMGVGSILGLLAGYRGGSFDSVLMRWVDLMWALPSLLVIVVVAGTLKGGYWLAVLLMTILSVPFDTRVVRGATLEQVRRPYVEAAKTLGVSDRRIMLFHVWPNVSSVVAANTFLVFVGALVGLSGLSFLGLGAPPGVPDWGRMLSDNRSLLFQRPVLSLAPGGMIVLTAVAMALVGDWLYERVSSRGISR